MKNMKNPILLLTAFLNLLTLQAFAQSNLEVPLSRPDEPGIVRVNANFADEIQIRTHDRNVVMIAYDGDDIESESEEEVRKDGMRKISGGTVGIEVTEDNNEVRINSGPMPTGDLELKIFIPRNFDVIVNSVQGDLIIDGLEGNFEISTVNGDVEISNIIGSGLINSVNGDIEVSFLEVTPDADMSFTGVNGDIEVSLPEDVKFTAKMKTEWGDIYTNFDMEIEKNSGSQEVDQDSGKYRVAVNKWIIGKVNGGGGRFLFKTLHGDISIRKK